jgi:hypothetical protein
LELHLHSLVDDYLLQEESLWKSKSRELWLTSVDLNTKFFHTSTLIRRRRNSIDTLHSPQLGLLTNRRAIGSTALFYVKYWNHIKGTVLNAVGDFFMHNILLRKQNHTFIVLIPKKLGASSVHQFISKLLANWLKPLLDKIISPFQTAFVPGRLIQDNSFLAHEMLHTLKQKRGRGGLMVINIDMVKMEWPFILAILKQLGFHDKWINWNRICISTTSFSVLLNGSSFGYFKPSRGLRQGDPLSPFLFIIGTEAISRMLHNSLRGFKISRSSESLNHLLFTDDLVVFTSATSSEASIIKNCLDRYSF